MVMLPSNFTGIVTKLSFPSLHAHQSCAIGSLKNFSTLLQAGHSSHNPKYQNDKLRSPSDTFWSTSVLEIDTNGPVVNVTQVMQVRENCCLFLKLITLKLRFVFVSTKPEPFDFPATSMFIIRLMGREILWKLQKSAFEG